MTTKTIEILYDRYIKGKPEREASVEEERGLAKKERESWPICPYCHKEMIPTRYEGEHCWWYGWMCECTEELRENTS